VLASIPYRTYPTIEIGPVNLHTFGLTVAIGMMLGIWAAARYLERRGISRDEVYKLGFKLILWGVVGARLAWALTHWDELSSPLEVFAIWEGGLTFTGGFLLAVIVALPTFRRWTSEQRWNAVDGIALGLALGVGIGRIGCYLVGEHLGGPTSFFLASKYLGGETREGPLVVGQVIHNTSTYEFLHLMALSLVLWLLLSRSQRLVPGTAMGIFCVWYGVARFGTDFLRAYDETVMGLTAAQYLSVVLLGVGIWIFATTGRRRARLALTGDASDSDIAHTE
jgi:phosphatidylglycerol:prolipoprotein diacylglycerol transferase